MHILALVPGGVSDQLLFFPTLDTLREAYPNATIDVVTDPRGLGAYQVCQTVRKAVSFDFNDRNSLADWSNLLGIIREQEYEVALIVKGGWEIGLLLWLCGVPTRVGYSDSETWFLTHRTPPKEKQYLAHHYHDLLGGLGLTQSCPTLQINLPRKDIEWAEVEQTRLGIGEAGYILVCPEQSLEAYPIQNWKLILQNIQERQPDLSIVIAETTASPELLTVLDQATIVYKSIFTRETSKLAALIAGSNLLLCPAGDALQLAVAVQTFTVALFGAANPERFLPQNNKFIGIQSSTGKIADISPQQVLDTIFSGN